MSGPTTRTEKILTVMLGAAAEHHYGLDIAREASLPPGAIYPVLIALEQQRWVESGWDPAAATTPASSRRRYYRLTPEGAQHARLMCGTQSDSRPSTQPVQPLRPLGTAA